MRSFRLVSVVAACAGALLLLTLRPLMRAQAEPPRIFPDSGLAVNFAVSPRVSDLPPAAVAGPAGGEEVEGDRRLEFRPPAVSAGKGSIDAAVFRPPVRALSAPLPKVMPAPIVSFAGLSTADNGNFVHPPDTVGDVGPNHYVQLVNLRFRIFNKSGSPLTPALPLSSLFAALGPDNRCTGVDNGDGIALYDPLADRWLLSQFCVSVANPNTHQLIAISQTGDPTGAWYLYDFMMPNNFFNDYPHFAVWRDSYFMTDHQFALVGNQYFGQGVFAFDRAKMVAGDPSAGFIYFDLFPLDPDIGGMLASDIDGLNPPPPGSPGYFVNWRADEYGDPADALQIFEFHADFANPAASTFTQRPESRLAVPAFDPQVPGLNVIEQPGASASQFLDAIQDRFMHRLAYRNFGGQESIVVTHTVNVGPAPSTPAGHQAAVRYYELRRNLPGGVFFVNNAATYAPDTDNRWMGSAAADNQGNIAIGYSVSSATVSPSIRYAGRLATDPPNGLFQGEGTLIAGSGRQTSSSGRWGDYSALSVDPADDCTFWYTTEYYASIMSVNWVTRIGSFKFPVCTAAAKGTLQGTIRNCSTSALLSGALVQAAGAYLRSTSAAGTYSMAMVPGTYGVTVSRPGYMTASASGIVVTNGSTTTADLCLTPVPDIAFSAVPSASAETCAPATGGLDPGETVSMSFSLKNGGATGTSNLVATLLATGGVTIPGAAQSYGALPPGGAAVSRTFSFTVDPAAVCGDKVTATLHLQDGANDLGNRSFVLTLGEIFRESFDLVPVYSLPAGWEDSEVGIETPSAWATTTVTGLYASAPQAAACGSSASVSERLLTSPVIAMPSIGARLGFRHYYSLETGKDGGVLEISIAGGAFTDIIMAGGSFAIGGYNGTISTASGSAIGGRQAWTGGDTSGSNGFLTTTINMPAGASGQSIRLRWRAAFDNATSQPGAGWRIDEVSLVTISCCGTNVLAAPPAPVTAEGCSPNNGAADPGEPVSVSLPLRNTGTSATSNLVATLLPGGGVGSPGAPQNYGAVPAGGAAVPRTFSFAASGACGGSVTLTLQLQDGATNLGTRVFTLMLGGLTPFYTENFDGVSAPALPAGWVASRPVGSTPGLWTTTAGAGFQVSAPNGAATGSTGTGPSDNQLTSPTIPVPAADGARLTFQNNYSLEDGYDGGVLEISIGGGPFTDIVAAGGSFVAGGYDQVISSLSGSTIAGRQAWTGVGAAGSNGFITTIVTLPAAALGQNIRLKWRATFDAGNAPGGTGWRIDDVSLAALTCCKGCVGGLPRDLDGDGHGDPACGGNDCNEADGQVWGTPAGVTSLVVATNSPSGMTWDGQAALSGPGTLYDLVAGEVPSSGALVFSPAACLQNSTATAHSDARPQPATGTAHWYLARARNSCGTGSYGAPSRDSSIPPCP